MARIESHRVALGLGIFLVFVVVEKLKSKIDIPHFELGGEKWGLHWSSNRPQWDISKVKRNEETRERDWKRERKKMWGFVIDLFYSVTFAIAYVVQSNALGKVDT